jgi:putative peptide zinc metalloprotease protein
VDKPLFSEHWYRVKSLSPSLRPHTRLHRHEYRGEIWYVLEDDSNARFHRFNTAAYHVIGLMNGKRSVQQIWEQVNTELGDDAPVQDELIALLGQLHQVDAIDTGIPPDVQELFQRGEDYERRQSQGRFKNPMALRLALFDPDRFLDAALPLVRPLFSPWFALAWCVLIVSGVLLAGSNWDALLSTAREQTLLPRNLLLMWLAYPLVKLLHELGHAFAAKLEGGEVHEMGIMFLVFVPVPYVDASAATVFRDKRKRMLVGAAGVMVEMLLATFALFLWLNVEPGLVRDVCFNVMLIGSVSTVLFNGNPLLRFDGYYVMADALGIPNLAARSRKYLAYLVQAKLFGMDEATSPVTSSGEAAWFTFYALASFAYRMAILLVICLFLIDSLFIVGVLLALWATFSQLVMPLAKQLHFVFFNPALRARRPRAMLLTLLCPLVLAAVVMWLPVSSLTRFEGVVWPPDESQLVTQTDGFVEQVLVEPGSQVSAGQPLLQLSNDTHRSKMAVHAARMKELSASLAAARVSDRVQARLVQEEISALQGEIDGLQQKINGLQLRSPSAGVFLLPQSEDLPGQYLKQGRLLGYVVNKDVARARVVITQDDLDRAVKNLEQVELRLASAADQVITARLLREVPQASNQLPSKVLSVEGGGEFALDPGGLTPLSTLERVFEFEVELPLTAEQVMIGTRVHVRFDHGNETLWTQFYRRFRQLFLSRLNV